MCDLMGRAVSKRSGIAFDFSIQWAWTGVFLSSNNANMICTLDVASARGREADSYISKDP